MKIKQYAMNDLQSFYNKIKKRYGEIEPKALEAVLSPLVITTNYLKFIE